MALKCPVLSETEKAEMEKGKITVKEKNRAGDK